MFSLVSDVVTVPLWNIRDETHLQMASIEAAVALLKDARATIKGLTLNACSATLGNFGFTVDDANFFIRKMTEDAKAHRYRDTMYRMPFVQQRTKVKCCRRICRFIMWIDLMVQSLLHKVVCDQIARFDADVSGHFEYVPDDGALDGTDVTATLEDERSPDGPRVGTRSRTDVGSNVLLRWV